MSENNIYFRSCSQECEQPIKTDVKGILPIWLKGTLLLNGPGLRKIGQDQFDHLFDGLALMHSFHIENGNVLYKNKFLRSDSFNRNIKANKIVVTEFGTKGSPDPHKTLWQRFLSYITMDMTDNASVNFINIRDQIYATTETKFIRRIDQNNLETYEKLDLSKYIGMTLMTAHPHIGDNCLYNISSNMLKGKYNLIKIPNTENGLKESTIVCSIKMKRPFYPSYYHSFSITQNYYIFIEQPLVLSVLSMIRGKTPSDSLIFKPNLMTRFYLIRRKNGQIVDTKYISEAFIFFHTINAYEENNHVIIDIVCYSDDKIINNLTEKNRFENQIPEIRRFILPIVESREYLRLNYVDKTSNLVKISNSKAIAFVNDDFSIKLTHETLSNPSEPKLYDMPRINDKFNGRKYQFFYSILIEHFNYKLMKFDLNTNEKTVWSEENTVPMEPIFVANPNSEDEDEGVILSLVLSKLDESQGFLLILDAGTFLELARAEFRTHSSIPVTFHGLFLE